MASTARCQSDALVGRPPTTRPLGQRCVNNKGGDMKAKRMIAVLAVVIVWVACGSETPVAPEEETESAGVLLKKTAAPPAEESATTGEGTGELLYACYNPSGSVYRIKEEDLRDECSSPTHVQFSWNEHGPQGDKGDPGELALAGQTCPDGEFVTGFDATGAIVCSGGGGPEPPIPPVEVCNGIDDDLDGLVDEGLFYCINGTPAPNTDGDHSCLTVWWVDANGDPADGCEAEWVPPTEVCNGIDDDLDREIDEGLFYCLLGGLPAPNTDGANSCLPGWLDSNADPADGCETLELDITVTTPWASNFRTTTSDCAEVCVDFTVFISSSTLGGSTEILQKIGNCPGGVSGQDVFSMPTNLELAYTARFSGTGPASVTICTWVDPNDLLPESDETNNKLEVDFSLPDAVITRQEYVP